MGVKGKTDDIKRFPNTISTASGDTKTIQEKFRDGFGENVSNLVSVGSQNISKGNQGNQGKYKNYGKGYSNSGLGVGKYTNGGLSYGNSIYNGLGSSDIPFVEPKGNQNGGDSSMFGGAGSPEPGIIQNGGNSNIFGGTGSPGRDIIQNGGDSNMFGGTGTSGSNGGTIDWARERSLRDKGNTLKRKKRNVQIGDGYSQKRFAGGVENVVLYKIGNENSNKNMSSVVDNSNSNIGQRMGGDTDTNLEKLTEDKNKGHGEDKAKEPSESSKSEDSESEVEECIAGEYDE
ncbi:hypothetical protein BB560_004701 [Smittium megazygosporum]|uniref:Uncharacterized protein n=1 Tax=Smittium megazygosporum TaxID=133381 RepID=A0A2T9Z8H2_9FUNG|nr:hypothetical protein BB560_004701 [Smittium megazygosporum]